MPSTNVWGGIGASSSTAAGVTSSQIAYRALRLLGVLRPGASASPEYLSDCHDALNALVDTWSLDRMMVYVVARERFTLTPGQSAYTIGSGGDFQTGRPPQMDRVSVLVPVGTATVAGSSVAVVSTGGGLTWNDATQTWDAVTSTWDSFGDGGTTTQTEQITITHYAEYPLENLNYDQWRMVPYKGDSSQYPSSFYYEPSYPLGVVNLWPTPSQAYPVLLGTWQQIGYFDTLDTPYSLPPGYAEALVYGLAAQIAPMFAIVAKIPAPHIASIEDKAQKLKAGIQSVNAPAPVMSVDSTFFGYARGFFDISTNR
jgi:hypothetical protein